MATLTKVLEDARTLSARARAQLISKLIMADMPNLITEEEDLMQREEDVRRSRVPHIEVSTVMKEARTMAGIKTTPPALKRRRR